MESQRIMGAERTGERATEIMYAGTIQLQACSYCPNLRPPDQLVPLTTYSEGVEIGRYLACNECAEKIEAMGKRIAEKAREALTRQRHEYDRVECQGCGGSVAENWIIRHLKAGCGVGIG
jgi:hypothetical protein